MGLIAGALLLLTLSGAAAAIQDVSQAINTGQEVAGMSKTASGLIGLLLFALPVVLGLLYFVWVYNGLVKQEEGVYGAWADVESSYKRRADLVPNLVKTVQGYLEHERQTLVEVTDRRNDLGEALKSLAEQQRHAGERLASAGPESPEGLAALERSQAGLMQSLRGVLATAEAYPNLRSADQFLALQAELEGTENRINVARSRFNDSVREFNAAIRRIPGSLVAGLGQFERKAYFTAAPGDEQAVEVRLGSRQ
jgi:LemA protein